MKVCGLTIVAICLIICDAPVTGYSVKGKIVLVLLPKHVNVKKHSVQVNTAFWYRYAGSCYYTNTVTLGR